MALKNLVTPLVPTFVNFDFENRTYQIKSILQTGKAQGQRLLDASLTQLMKERVITTKEAIKHAEEPENFK